MEQNFLIIDEFRFEVVLFLLIFLSSVFAVWDYFTNFGDLKKNK